MASMRLIAILVSVSLFCFVNAKNSFQFEKVKGSKGTVLVNTTYGQVRGLQIGEVCSFRGIPYAQPPINNLRFKAPLETNAWYPNVLDGTNWAAGCPQNCQLPPNTCPWTTSEDCLTLDIYAPCDGGNGLQPTMLFIPGGRFQQGSADSALYDGNYFVARSGVVLVVINYRLGALGWVAVDNLIPGNAGFFDQRLALQFVQKEILAFGGDSNSVTLFGESAGGASTTAHVVSPNSAGLFHRAIIESNPFTLPYREDADTLGSSFAEQLGCSESDLNCFLNADLKDILAAQEVVEDKFSLFKPLESFMPWGPVIDPTELPSEALDAFVAGKYNHVPLMLGTCSEEALMFIYLALNSTLTDVEYGAALTDIFVLDAPSVLLEYPAPIFGDKRPLLSQLGTDYIFLAPSRYAAVALAESQSQPVYLYEFNHSMSFDGWGERYWFCRGHVCHGSELPFVFHTSGNFSFTDQEIELSNSMIDYWTNFAYSGDPNQGVSVEITWDPVTGTDNVPYLILQTEDEGGVQVQTDVRTDYSEFWAQLGFHHGW